MAKSIEASTGGKYKVQQFANSALGGEREVIEGLQIGTIDLAIVSTGPPSILFPKPGFSISPSCCATCRTPARCWTARSARTCWPSSQPRHHRPGLGEQGFRHLTNNVRPVKTPADAKGLKIRTTENPIHIAAFRQIGILPTPMAWPEVATALQQGTIDGQENPLSVITSAKLSQCRSTWR